MSYAVLTEGLTAAQRAAMDEGLAGLPRKVDPGAKPRSTKFGPDWGENATAQAGQDAALAMVGISMRDLLPEADEAVTP